MRIVSTTKLTIDARWIVVDNWLSKEFESILFDPDNGDTELDLADCLIFVREKCINNIG